MELDSSTLPSNGLYTLAHFIKILPLTYSKLSEYEDEPADTEIQEMMRDIKYFISPIPDWRNLLLFDYDALCFTAKYITISTKPELTILGHCPEHGEFKTKLSLPDIVFSSLTKEDLNIKSISLGGNSFPINFKTTIGAFYDLLLELNKWNLKLNRKDVMLMALISTETTRNQAFDAITHATGDDISLIKYLSNGKITSSATVTCNCPTCNKEVVMGLNSLITKIFRLIDLNADLSQKITYYK